MSDADPRERRDEAEPIEHDPDLGSTWNTINNTAEIEDLMAEQELEDFMSEPPDGELSIIADTDVPGEPG
jgi:hypothetical protein